MVAVCGCRPLGRSDRREVRNSENPCPAGMDVEARRGHPEMQQHGKGSLSHVVTRHGNGEVRTGEAPAARS